MHRVRRYLSSKPAGDAQKAGGHRRCGQGNSFFVGNVDVGKAL
jgi:hypothetical protein